MQSIINIDKESFKTQLIELKKNFKKDSFGFIQDFYVNFNQVEIEQDTIKVTRNPNMLNPFRGTGHIIGTLKELNESKLIIEYEIKPEISLSNYLIFFSLLFAVWFIYVFYIEALWLGLIGILVAGLILVFIYTLNRFNIKSLNKYFQELLKQIQN
jgi:hypothetical protein